VKKVFRKSTALVAVVVPVAASRATPPGSNGLIVYQSEFLSDPRGSAVFNRKGTVAENIAALRQSYAA